MIKTRPQDMGSYRPRTGHDRVRHRVFLDDLRNYAKWKLCECGYRKYPKYKPLAEDRVSEENIKKDGRIAEERLFSDYHGYPLDTVEIAKDYIWNLRAIRNGLLRMTPQQLSKMMWLINGMQ